MIESCPPDVAKTLKAGIEESTNEVESMKK